jgi:hypothetical protein
MDLMSKLLIAVLLVMLGCLGGEEFRIAGLKVQLASKENDRLKLDGEFTSYREKANEQALAAQAEKQRVEQQAADNERKTRNEQEQMAKAGAAERARLLGTISGLRVQLDAYAAGTAGDAARGDVAALAARATTAGKLLAACTGEYSDLASRAEETRQQAVGLYTYIKGNPMCSTPFGAAAP